MLTSSFSDVSSVNGKGISKGAFWNLVRAFSIGAMGPREAKEKAEKSFDWLPHNDAYA